MESLGNQQYSVKMDGSGRVSLRNRKCLRKIEPLLPRSLSLDDVLGHQQVGGAVRGEDEVVTNVPEDEIVDETVVDEQPKRSTRVRHSPDWYEAK